jgi:phosphoribosylglycinamide formyltransferase-1
MLRLPVNRRIIVLTGSELRHTFFRKFIAQADGITVLQSFCEGAEKSISAIVATQPENELRIRHLRAREQSEEDFFSLYVDATAEHSNPVFLPKGEINSTSNTQKIISAAPDLIVAYGCSIICEPLLAAFPRRIVNVHLGLSPFYRGSGTNYWPLVNREPELYRCYEGLKIRVTRFGRLRAHHFREVFQHPFQLTRILRLRCNPD